MSYILAEHFPELKGELRSAIEVATKIVKRNTHRNRTDIEIFLVDHIYRFKYILCIYHIATSNSVHGIENILMHNMYTEVIFLADSICGI